MDFSQFDSRAAADEGRDMHVKHPATGELLYDNGEPCLVRVLGTESRSVQAEIAKVRAAKVAEGRKDEKTLAELYERLVDAARPLVAGFPSGIHRGKRKAKAPDDVDWFLSLQMVNGRPDEKSFAEQIAEFSTRRAHFLGVPSKG